MISRYILFHQWLLNRIAFTEATTMAREEGWNGVRVRRRFTFADSTFAPLPHCPSRHGVTDLLLVFQLFTAKNYAKRRSTMVSWDSFSAIRLPRHFPPLRIRKYELSPRSPPAPSALRKCSNEVTVLQNCRLAVALVGRQTHHSVTQSHRDRPELAITGEWNNDPNLERKNKNDDITNSLSMFEFAQISQPPATTSESESKQKQNNWRDARTTTTTTTTIEKATTAAVEKPGAEWGPACKAAARHQRAGSVGGRSAKR